MGTKQNTDYGYDIQKVYLEMMMSDAQSFVRCQSIFDHTLFDRRLQESARFMNEYVEEHRVLPTFEIVNAATKSDLKSPGDNIDERHFDAFFANTSCGLSSRIIEFASLSDNDRATADDEYVF